MAGYDELRREQAEKRERGELMGIGVSFFTERRRRRAAQAHGHPPAWAWPTAPSCACTRPARRCCASACSRRARATRRRSPRSSPRSSASRPRTSRSSTATPTTRRSASGTYGSRSTPVSGAAAAVVARKVRDKARIIAAAMLEASPDDLEWEKGRWFVKGDPEQGETIQEIAMAAHGTIELPEGVEGAPRRGRDLQPAEPDLSRSAPTSASSTSTRAPAQVKVRRFIAVDDCGTRINPMIVEGQIHGGLAEGIGMALMQIIAFDEEGNCLNGSFMDYLIPTSMEVPDWELGETVTPSPHHPLGAKGVGESATVGSPPAVVNAVLDALELGVRHIDMPLTPARVWAAMQGNGGAAAVIARRCAARRELARPASPFVEATVVRARGRRARGRATARSCSPTARSRASSAARAPSRPCGCTRCARWRPASRCCCGSCRAGRRRRAGRGGRGRRGQPVPERRRARDLPRAARAGAARGVVGDSPVAARAARARLRVGWASGPAVGAQPSRDSPWSSPRSARRRGGGAAPPRSSAGARTSAWWPAARAARRCSTRCARRAPRARERVHTPAGLDIGARTHAEIALSILAELVAVAAAPASAPAPAVPAASGGRPVCG